MKPAITHLARAIPPPEAPRTHDWARVEDELGTVLPGDYKQLLGLYGGGLFDKAIWLLEPDCPNTYYDLLTENRECRSSARAVEGRGAQARRTGRSGIPHHRVGRYGERDCLYWLVRPGEEPEQWTVAIKEGHGREREFHAQSCSAFLRPILVAGDIESDLFYDLPTEEAHQFAPSAGFL
ncbi:SMI1/KNR4 family protein [Streptomyces sp. PvR034]|uniref:SMI1/KNR4 family protein n=1 Tax=Streptomyces sp. PvR034 TaxID=3156401 RepID=UPI003393F8B1